MTGNVTFMRFLCCDLITSQVRSYKVYISLKLRAFYTHFKKENSKIGTWTKIVGWEIGYEGTPDPRGGIEIQLSQYLRYMSNVGFIVFRRPLVKKACLRILIFQAKVPIMYP